MNNEPSKPGNEIPEVSEDGQLPKPAPLPEAAPLPQTAAPASVPIAQTNAPAAVFGMQPMGKPATTVTAGTLIMGTYEIEKLINSGGMGEVYRGRNIHNGEPVAIKIVLPSLAHDPKIVALFQKESTTLSRLSHEAIVRYHVFTVDPTIGRPCMVMEFVSGLALSDRIEQGPMPLQDVKVMLRRVASGLDKAHRAGVVHRDLSPDNVILEEGSVEHAKLIDFGIAKSTAVGAGTLLQGQFAGKFNWVSPEQLGAFGGHVDGRSDIYSLALITAGVSRGEVLQMGASIVDAVGKRASVPDLTGVAPELVPLLSWMLQPDPAQRADSMATVMAAIDNPSLVPMAKAPEPRAPDPNRTVIGGVLPKFDAPEAATPTPAPNWPSTSPPATSPAGLPPLTSNSPPEGATVISGVTPRTGLDIQGESEDVSPFGAPASATPVSQPMNSTPATPQAKKGKGGVLATVAVLALIGGGAGAYYAGVFGPKPGDPVLPVTEATTPTNEQAATDKAATDKAATDKAATDKAAAEQKAAEDATAKLAADAKQATDSAAAKQAEAEAAAKKAADEVAATDANDAAAKKAAEETAKAADEAAKKATEEAAAAKAAQEAAAKQAADDAAAKQAADEAAAKQAADEAAAKQAADEAAAKQAADEAAAKQAADEAAKSDPVALQTNFLAAYSAPKCVFVGQMSAEPKGFQLSGFATDTSALEALAKDWQTATKTKPDVIVHLIDEPQCPVLDLMNRHSAANAQPLQVHFAKAGEVVKSGEKVSGVVEGLQGRSLTLFLVPAAGDATSLKPWVTLAADGTANFSFTVRLPKGAAPAPQLLLALATSEPMDKLEAIPNRVSALSLMPFIEVQLADFNGQIGSGLGFFRLEN